MKHSQFLHSFLILNILTLPFTHGIDKFVPVVVTTWDYKNATQIGII